MRPWAAWVCGSAPAICPASSPAASSSALARALINHPELILADEPTGNLDEANENIVLDLCRQLHREGTTLIVVTHDPEVAEAAQRTIVLEHGRVAREIINENFVE